MSKKKSKSDEKGIEKKPGSGQPDPNKKQEGAGNSYLLDSGDEEAQSIIDAMELPLYEKGPDGKLRVKKPDDKKQKKKPEKQDALRARKAERAGADE